MIILYTLKDCDFCIELKKQLKTRNIIFEERDTEDENFIEEYAKIVLTTKNDMIPIIRKDKNFYLPNEDFENISDALTLITTIY